MNTKQQELESMMTVNFNKVNEDFRDNVRVEDEVRVDVTAGHQPTTLKTSRLGSESSNARRTR